MARPTINVGMYAARRAKYHPHLWGYNIGMGDVLTSQSQARRFMYSPVGTPENMLAVREWMDDWLYTVNTAYKTEKQVLHISTRERLLDVACKCTYVTYVGPVRGFCTLHVENLGIRPLPYSLLITAYHHHPHTQVTLRKERTFWNSIYHHHHNNNNAQLTFLSHRIPSSLSAGTILRHQFTTPFFLTQKKRVP